MALKMKQDLVYIILESLRTLVMPLNDFWKKIKECLIWKSQEEADT